MSFYLLWALFLLSLGGAFNIARIVAGPTELDRIIGMEGVGLCAMGLILLAGLWQAEAYFLDIAMVFFLVSYIGTVAAALLIGGRNE